MEFVEEKAYAKVNLCLGVLYKRTDGYHALDTLMQTVSLCDSLTLRPSKRVEVQVSGMALPHENTLYTEFSGRSDYFNAFKERRKNF